jgi:hypothetical protein
MIGELNQIAPSDSNRRRPLTRDLSDARRAPTRATAEAPSTTVAGSRPVKNEGVTQRIELHSNTEPTRLNLSVSGARSTARAHSYKTRAQFIIVTIRKSTSSIVRLQTSELNGPSALGRISKVSICRIIVVVAVVILGQSMGERRGRKRSKWAPSKHLLASAERPGALATDKAM